MRNPASPFPSRIADCGQSETFLATSPEPDTALLLAPTEKDRLPHPRETQALRPRGNAVAPRFLPAGGQSQPLAERLFHVAALQTLSPSRSRLVPIGSSFRGNACARRLWTPAPGPRVSAARVLSRWPPPRAGQAPR